MSHDAIPYNHMLLKNIKNIYIPVYAATLLLSAFLLFLVQPMTGKMMLPLLGGAPAVWNTAMLFFQALLLAGYAYAHLIARYMKLKAQAVLHVFLLVLFAMLLPIAVPQGWTAPPPGGNPALWQLSLMTLIAGGPFFILSASAPLLQHWFAHTRHDDAHNPYFLYAASNFGSMTALLAYPVLVEPSFDLARQSFGWACFYALLVPLVFGCALLANTGTARKTPAEPADSGLKHPIGLRRCFMWLILAFVPSSLMLGVTTFMTTDLAAVPLLWVAPLALYVSTFISAFARTPRPGPRTARVAQAALLILLLTAEVSLVPLPKALLLCLHLLLFYFTALMCHQELAASRPAAGGLTRFYLILSLGGVMGGIFNALAAPALFTSPREYGIALAFAAFMRYAATDGAGLTEAIAALRRDIAEKKLPALAARLRALLPACAVLAAAAISTRLVSHAEMLMAVTALTLLSLSLAARRRWIFGLCALAVLLFHQPGQNLENLILKNITVRERNFFGILKVGDSIHDPVRLLLHGTTIHGVQALSPEYAKVPLSYYSAQSPLSDVFAMADTARDRQQYVAVLGLGIGVTACYRKQGRHFDFYEIDPAVIAVAQDRDLFTYLSGCGSPYDILTGDGRLKIAEKPDSYYDLVFLDVFSSDNIPVHILTLEALNLYRQKLKDNGTIVINISNHFLDLRPVIAAAAAEMGMTALSRFTPAGRLEGSGLPYNGAEFAVLTASEHTAGFLEGRGWKQLEPSPGTRPWTDRYSDIVGILKIFR